MPPVSASGVLNFAVDSGAERTNLLFELGDALSDGAPEESSFGFSRTIPGNCGWRYAFNLRQGESSFGFSRIISTTLCRPVLSLVVPSLLLRLNVFD